jgi:hypothetical protein
MRISTTLRWVVLPALIVALLYPAVAQQKTAIKIEAMSIHKLNKLGLPNPNDWDNVSYGLSTVGVGSMVWLSGWDITGDSTYKAGANYLWEMTSKPTGSTATLSATNVQTISFKPDMEGSYGIKLTIGTKDTTMTVKAAKYTGTDRHNVATSTFNCATCHASAAKPEIFNAWKTSDHGTMFQRGLNGQIASYWGESCFKCHTTGYSKDPLAANNGGFVNLATQTGFVASQWQPWRAGRYDSLLTTDKKNLSLVSSIGCESCHGPKDPTHVSAGTQPKTMSSDVCAPCHDEPWRHNRYAMWANSAHSGKLPTPASLRGYTGTSVITGSGFNLNACTRCHDGKAFVSFTKGTSFDPRVASGYSRLARTPITCQTCHDPHSMQLRTAPSASDTLATGFNYATANLGSGKLCVNCHKYRRAEFTTVGTNMSSTWGPHYAGAADIFLGQNGHTYGKTVASSIAHRLVENSCVGCHMSATPDTSSAARDHIGGHSWKMSYTAASGTVFNNVTGCVSCHTGITKFSDIQAAMDYDLNGVVESFTKEVEGLQKRIAMALPPFGSEEVNRTMISASPDSVEMKKAFWNYLFTKYDGSRGVHNPKYVIGLLQGSLNRLTGVEFPEADLPLTFELAQNYPNPFNPSTQIGFSLPKQSPVKLQVFDIMGREVATLVDEVLPAGAHKVVWNGRDQSGTRLSSGMYFYRIQATEFIAVKRMALVK